MIVVLPFTIADEANVPPNATDAPVANPVPEIVTVFPPVVDPEVGETLLTIGDVLDAVPKNSAMPGAVADAPGKLLSPSP